MISFDNTEIAFARLADNDLKQAHWLFRLMGKSWLVKIGTRFTPWAIKAGLPINGAIRKTIFKQFVGGETLEETKPVVNKLSEYGVQVILDYGVEGKEGESNYDLGRDEFVRVIRFAASQKTIPYISIKVTGMARFSLLEKIDELMRGSEANTLIKRYNEALQSLDALELAEWQRVIDRVRRICEEAATGGIAFMVDAEETWIQDPIDAITMLMMDTFNHDRLVIYNTVQLYRHDRLAFLMQSFEAALERNFILGVKLVRGAYMEKERKRASEKGYTSPIQPNKESSDRDYDEAVRFCLDHIEQIGLIVATHNEKSNLLTTKGMQERGMPLNHPRVHFSQLYGMSDNITFNLAREGCSVSKYLPFGPIHDVVPYLMRRAQENTSVGGQTSRELQLIEREMRRRKK